VNLLLKGEKDRATHAIAGVKMEKLWRPPYLQVALDIIDMDYLKKVVTELPKSDSIILEAGTPLSFDVLCNELRGLGLNIQLEKKRLGSAVL